MKSYSKNKVMSVLAICLIIAATTLAWRPPIIDTLVTVYAAEQGTVKSAVLNNIKISFEGNDPVTVQAYNIDGYNYVRARDITNGLNMDVEAMGKRIVDDAYGKPIEVDAVGIRIYPDKKPTSTVTTEKLTASSIQVQLVDGEISYRNMITYVKCFNYNGRYYFKVADLGVASRTSLESAINVTKAYGRAGIRTAPADESYTAVDVNWNSSTGVIEVTKDVTDLWAVFREASRSTVAKAEPRQAKETTTIDPSKSTLHPNTLREGEAMKNGTWKPIDPDFSKQSPLVSAPKVGTRLANILIDESLGAYSADGSLNEDNVQPFYKYNNLTGNFGQCAWYAEGRFSEVTGVDSRNNKYWAGTGNVLGWIDNVKNNDCPDVDVVEDVNDIRAQSIAVFNGHVAFIEYVEYDSNGNPSKVYVTEANTNRTVKPELVSGRYHPEYDALVKVFDFDVFVKEKGNGSLRGYIIAKQDTTK